MLLPMTPIWMVTLWMAALPKGGHWTIKAVEQAWAAGNGTIRWVLVTNGY